MSSIVSNMMIERTLSQSQSHFAAKTLRTVEDEIIHKVNSYRFKIPQVKEKLEERIRTSANPEDCTITLKEINKTVHYESQEQLDKLMKYLSYLSEMKHTIPDLFQTPSLHTIFCRNFGSVIDTQKGLLQKNSDHYEKLKKLIPSKKYLGIHVPNIDLKDVDAILHFMILQEFLMVSDKNAHLNTDNLVIEIDDEMPQHISIFDPSFNSLTVYANEKERRLYLLFLTDVYEIMDPDTMELPETSKMEIYDSSKRARYSNKDVNPLLEKTVKLPKYENLRTSLPDISLEQCQKFVNLLDSDNDYRININDVTNLVNSHKIAWEEHIVPAMFDEIFQRRNVVVETQRRNPVDAYEIFHAIRYKCKKDKETQQWVHTARPYREQWLVIFKLVDIGLPKFALPPLETKPLYNNYEITIQKGVPQNNYGETQKFIVKEPKPEILKKQYRPEADILIQNTQNIMEVYIDDRDPNKTEDQNKNAFQTLVNAKFKDVTQKSEFQTVDFNAQAYYKEALRLSMNPEAYLNEKVNPLYKFMPIKKETSYNHQAPQEIDSLKDFRSGMQSDEAEIEESVEATAGSKRVTMYSIRDPFALTKSKKSFKSGTGMTLAPISNTPNSEAQNKIYGSQWRKTILSSSLKERTHSPQNLHSNRPLFLTSFKLPDNETLKVQKAKLEPIVDVYNPPKLHQFRENNAPENKPQFLTNWKEEIPEVFTNDTKDLRSKEVLEKEYYQKMMAEMKYRRQHDPWIRYFKLAPRERGFVDHSYPEFLAKGSYTDGYVNAAPFIREAMETENPFKLFHRSLRKTDKNLFFGDSLPSNI